MQITFQTFSHPIWGNGRVGSSRQCSSVRTSSLATTRVGTYEWSVLVLLPRGCGSRRILSTLRELSEDCIHDFRRQNDLAVRNRHWSVLPDRTVKALNQIFHPFLCMKLPAQKGFDVHPTVAKILSADLRRALELLQEAFAAQARQPDQSLLILIHGEAVFRTVHAKLMKRGLHLRGEGEVGRSLLLFADDNPQLVNNFCFPHAAQ